MTHQEIEELLGAYALDAVSPQERDEIESHLAECPRCQQEVTAHEQVAGVLGSLGGTAPVGLWDRIASELAIGSGEPLGVTEPPPIAPVIAIEGARTRRAAVDKVKSGHDSRSSLTLVVMGSAAAVLLVVIGVLAGTIVNLNHKVSHLNSAIVTGGVTGQVKAAEQDPNHQTVQLTSLEAGKPWAADVVLDEGKAFLVPTTMPSIASGQTFQAWAVVSGKYVSLGVLGSKPGDTQIDLQAGMSKVLLNVEPEGGSAQPTTAPLIGASLPAIA